MSGRSRLEASFAAIERHLEHRVAEAESIEQVLRAGIRRRAPQHHPRHAFRFRPADRRAYQLLSDALMALTVVDIDVVHEAARRAQLPPAHGLEAGEDVAHHLATSLRDHYQAIGMI